MALRESVAIARARLDPPRFLLVVAGAEPDEARAARTIRGHSSGVDLWVVQGADHVGGLRADAEEWTRRVDDFLEQSLEVEPAG